MQLILTGFTWKFKEESGSVSWFRILDQTIPINHEFPKALKTLVKGNKIETESARETTFIIDERYRVGKE